MKISFKGPKLSFNSSRLLVLTATLLFLASAKSSGEVVLLEVTELDDEGQPAAFELVTDESIAREVYEDFQSATRDLYDFA